MAKTYGVLQGNRGQVTRCGGTTISAALNTWQRRVTLDLHDDDTLDIVVKRYSNGETIGARWRIHADEFAALLDESERKARP